jgi:hypothetical protein
MRFAGFAGSEWECKRLKRAFTFFFVSGMVCVRNSAPFLEIETELNASD